jgi:hypothetical protein
MHKVKEEVLTNQQIQNGLDVTSHQHHQTMYVFLDMYYQSQ